MAALLEQMEKQYDDAKGKSDDAKAAIKKVCPSCLFYLTMLTSPLEK
jgi:hypothetical protein